MTILELIKSSTDYLAGKGVESPRLQSELLLGHILGKPRLNLYLEFDKTLDEQSLSNYRNLIKRRAKREPLQHLIGSTSFCGFKIQVSSEVLIPRPETELLAEQGWLFLKKRTEAGFECTYVLDFGVGSGCLAIALAKKFSQAKIHGIDISSGALAIARANAAQNQVGSQVDFFEGNGFAAVPPSMRYDLIISNPPYIPSDDIPGLQPEVRDHDPRLALDGGKDGLDFYQILASQGPDFLNPGGQLMIEIGDGQKPAIETLFSDPRWHVECILADYARKPRIAILLKVC